MAELMMVVSVTKNPYKVFSVYVVLLNWTEASPFLPDSSFSKVSAGIPQRHAYSPGDEAQFLHHDRDR